MVVKLIRKLADFIDGVDLSRNRVGDVLRVSRRDGELLLAEGWATRTASKERSEKRERFGEVPQAEAADAFAS